MKYSVFIKCFLIGIMLLYCLTDAISQGELKNLLEEKTNFAEIVQIVDHYFDQHPELKSEEEGE